MIGIDRRASVHAYNRGYVDGELTLASFEQGSLWGSTDAIVIWNRFRLDLVEKKKLAGAKHLADGFHPTDMLPPP